MERLWNFETWKLDMELECHNVNGRVYDVTATSEG